MNTEPIAFYRNEINIFSIQLKEIKQKLLRLALIRLFVFLLTVFGVYYCIDIPKWPVVIGLSGFVMFLYLVSKYTDLKENRKTIAYLIKINQDEVDIIEGKSTDFDTGERFVDDEHAFASDIDLFGEGSFYQMINRAELKDGTQLLADTLKSNSTDEIEYKQAGIKELSNQPKWRQNFKATAHMIQTDVSRASIVSWLKDYKVFMPNFVVKLSFIFPYLSVLLIGLFIFDIVAFEPVLIIMGVGLLITGVFVKRINKLALHVGQLKQAFSNYSKLIALIEKSTFSSQMCLDQKEKITADGKLASEILSQFSKYLNGLDQRNNILFGVLGNGFLLWDCKHVYRIEQWISRYNRLVEDWFEAVEFYDANNSLANFSFNHPSYILPVLSEKPSVLIKAKDLGHIMINSNKRIDNDLIIDAQNFKIITGANMAGKSTFLRTIALSIVSANIGLPVCAKSYEYSPIKLVTSMRNTDSLKDDSSYFFSELVRLKYIVNAIKNTSYFIILDEILKGTNSKDKEEGSKKFMRKLAQSSSAGVIATHDLGLCEIAEEISSIQNNYFDAEIIDGELFFDYTLKDGICKNMNASFLLKKMEII